MRRLLPNSLLGQMLLLTGFALLVAQLVNLAFILSEQQKLSLAQSEGPALGRFAQAAGVVSHLPAEQRPALIALHRDPMRVRFTMSAASLVASRGLSRNPALENRLAGALKEAGVAVTGLEAASAGERLLPPPPPSPLFPPPPRRLGPVEHKVLILSARLPDGRWFNGRIVAPRLDHWLLHQILVATALLFLIVFGAVFWTARRLARPLQDLTHAAERFEGRAPPEPVEPRGPADIRAAIEAFNAMNRRTLALLDEKDRMLGAIGHDLRTPLASMRIRAESLEPEEERERLVATLEEMAGTLEDILVLARTGRARETVRPVDLAALADAVVEEQREMGRPAEFRPSPRAVLPVQPNLLRRAVRNLVDNAVAYGGRAWVAVAEEGRAVRIDVEDEGPGIAEEKLGEVLEPFRRLEESRSRQSGGAGLGLAIAEAVARAHGGRLTLDNRAEGGLRASLILPKP